MTDLNSLPVFIPKPRQRPTEESQEARRAKAAVRDLYARLERIEAHLGIQRRPAGNPGAEAPPPGGAE